MESVLLLAQSDNERTAFLRQIVRDTFELETFRSVDPILDAVRTRSLHPA